MSLGVCHQLSEMWAPIRHVMWDWNGTLLDDAMLCLDAMNIIMARRGLPPTTPEHYREIFGFPLRDVFVRLGFDLARDSYEAAVQEFMDIYEARKWTCKLRAGARECLAAIQASGRTQSVLSAYKQELLDAAIQHYELGSHFLRTVGIGDIFAGGKTVQGIKWIKELNLAPSAVVLIGDTLHDFEVAQAMGTQCWLIPSGNQSRARLEACGALVIDELSALHTKELFRGMP